MATNDGYEPYGINRTASEVVAAIEKSIFDYTPEQLDDLFDLKANDNAVVKIAGTQSITGSKTFTSAILGNLTGNVTGNSSTATKLTTARSITLSGDVTGSVNFDGTQNVTITTAVGDDSHIHTIGTVTGLQEALNLKSTIASPTFTGTPSAPTAAVGVNSTQIATTAFVNAEIQNDSSSENIGNMVIRRDASGNFLAGAGTFSGEVSTGTQLVIGSGGDSRRGCIYSDSNWGMFFRAKIDNPGMAKFVWMTGDGSEVMRINTSNHLQVANDIYVGGNLTVGNGKTLSIINMYDSDESTRTIYCNSNNIGFLNQSGGWGAYCSDNGDWSCNTAMYAPNFHGNLEGSAKLGRVLSGGYSNCNSLFTNTISGTTSVSEINNYSDAPSSGQWLLHSIRTTNSSNYWGTQVAYGYEGNANQIYQRTCSEGVWTLWKRVDSEVNAGTVIYHASSNTPVGWLKANGATVSRTTFSALFAIIGTTFGAGDGVNTFKLPDLRGEFIRGFDDGRGVDSGRSFGSWQAQDLQSHSHSYVKPVYISTATDYQIGVSNLESTSSGYTGSTGGTETRPRNVALLALIKY